MRRFQWDGKDRRVIWDLKGKMVLMECGSGEKIVQTYGIVTGFEHHREFMDENMRTKTTSHIIFQHAGREMKATVFSPVKFWIFSDPEFVVYRMTGDMRALTEDK